MTCCLFCQHSTDNAHPAQKILDADLHCACQSTGAKAAYLTECTGSFEELLALYSMLTLPSKASETSVHVQIVQYSGPLADTPGQLMRVAAHWALPGEERGQGPNKPWDVRWHKGIKGIGGKGESLLVVTRHAGKWRRCGSNVAIFSAVDGRLLKQLKFKQEHARHLRQTNMILID